jgi:hypothetical protein
MVRKTIWMMMLALLVGAGQGFGDADNGTCGDTTWNLTAGQTNVVGTVTVENDGDNIYVTYQLDDTAAPDACFGTLHVWVGNDLTNVPANPQGIPVPGQFCQADGGACFDASELRSHTFTIPWDQTGITDISEACDTTVYVVAHAEVDLDCTDENYDHETAFGGDQTGDGPRWWFYAAYTVCCDFGNVVVPFCETAFAKGGYVWTTHRRSNPENLPSLNLTKNRWGWAINLTATGETTYDIWAGAGLNHTSKGTLVGELTVIWDENGGVSLKYDMADGYCLEEVHVYVGDDAPATIAPGQFGHVKEFDPNATSYEYSTSLNDDGDIWIVAHAVVCNECD